MKIIIIQIMIQKFIILVIRNIIGMEKINLKNGNIFSNIKNYLKNLLENMKNILNTILSILSIIKK